VFLGDDFPEKYRGTLLVARYGNLLPLKQDVGFDVLQVRLRGTSAGRLQAEVKTFLSPVARPTDLHLSGKRKIYICERCRAISLSQPEYFSGRILELAVQESH
jgi:hypothetical protein